MSTAAEEKTRLSGDNSRSNTILPTINPSSEKLSPPKPTLHSAFYIIAWIGFSSGVILFNKWLLDTLNFRFPVVLTTWHMAAATIMTQIIARTTTLLDGRKKVKMTGQVYMRAILPIGFFFSLSLICGNKSYLYLSVAFIQMLKATNPVVVLLVSWALAVSPLSFKTLGNVSLIVVGVVIASVGEIKFDLTGFLYQVCGTLFEATRLVLVQRLLSSAEFKMDPLVSLYYFAPICTVMNGVVALLIEVPNMTLQNIYDVGILTLLANGMVAFMLNVSLVLLIGKTSSLVLTLCGVLKDILLVAASMLIWGTPVSATQFFGYSIALSGLIYYKLGGDSLQQYASQAGRRWVDFGTQKPVMRKVVVIAVSVSVALMVIGGLGPTFAPKPAKQLKDLLGGVSSLGS